MIGGDRLSGVVWKRVRLAVFDLDGTLYAQSCLRRRMAAAILGHLALHPADVPMVRVIRRFRQMREELAEEGAVDVLHEQYARPAAVLGLPPAVVAEVVGEWMERRPLPYLRRCRYPGVGELFAALRERGVRIACLSDYPAAAKLAALDLEVELAVSAVDREVDRLKPWPEGLRRVLDLAAVGAADSVMIGDRPERDGECAARAGVSFLHLSPSGEARAGRFADYRVLAREVAAA